MMFPALSDAPTASGGFATRMGELHVLLVANAGFQRMLNQTLMSRLGLSVTQGSARSMRRARLPDGTDCARHRLVGKDEAGSAHWCGNAIRAQAYDQISIILPNCTTFSGGILT